MKASSVFLFPSPPQLPARRHLHRPKSLPTERSHHARQSIPGRLIAPHPRHRRCRSFPMHTPSAPEHRDLAHLRQRRSIHRIGPELHQPTVHILQHAAACHRKIFLPLAARARSGSSTAGTGSPAPPANTSPVPRHAPGSAGCCGTARRWSPFKRGARSSVVNSRSVSTVTSDGASRHPTSTAKPATDVPSALHAPPISPASPPKQGDFLGWNASIQRRTLPTPRFSDFSLPRPFSPHMLRSSSPILPPISDLQCWTFAFHSPPSPRDPHPLLHRHPASSKPSRSTAKMAAPRLRQSARSSGPPRPDQAPAFLTLVRLGAWTAPPPRRASCHLSEFYGLDPAEFADPAGFLRLLQRLLHAASLKPEARPIDPAPASVVFPADGRHLGFARPPHRLGLRQGPTLRPAAPCSATPTSPQRFADGPLVLSRLCPVDYHRFHFPAAGTPGAPHLLDGPLFSVSPIALRRTLLPLGKQARPHRARPEHLGTILLIEIGATNVGSIQQTFTPGTPVAKGDEKGYFEFGGSSIITLFEPGTSTSPTTCSNSPPTRPNSTPRPAL